MLDAIDFKVIRAGYSFLSFVGRGYKYEGGHFPFHMLDFLTFKKSTYD
jgi:hypothetical protein